MYFKNCSITNSSKAWTYYRNSSKFVGDQFIFFIFVRNRFIKIIDLSLPTHTVIKSFCHPVNMLYWKVYFLFSRRYLARGGYARAVAIYQLLSASDYGHHFAAEYPYPWLEFAGTRRIPRLRVHHIVDRVVPVHQHGRAEVQAWISPSCLVTAYPTCPKPHPHH